MRTILITSGTKGGTGKSTIALNLSVLAAYRLRDKARYPVVLIDASIDSGSSSMLLFGHPNPTVQYTLIDLLDGRVTDPLSVFYLRQWQVDGSQFSLVFAASGFSSNNRYRPLYPLRSLFSSLVALSPILTIIDSPALGFSGEFLDITAPYLTDVIPIVTPDHSSIKATKLAIDVAREINPRINILTPILNMLDERYPIDASTGAPWVEIVRQEIGAEPHIIPLDEYIQISRQALEIEILKISPLESKGVSEIINYFDKAISKLIEMTPAPTSRENKPTLP